MIAQTNDACRRRWISYRALPGLTRVRAPFQPARQRALTAEARCRVEEAAYHPRERGAVRVHEWVNPDCRGVPHVLEVLVSGPEYHYLPTAAEKVDLIELQRLLRGGAGEPTSVVDGRVVASRGRSA